MHRVDTRRRNAAGKMIGGHNGHGHEHRVRAWQKNVWHCNRRRWNFDTDTEASKKFLRGYDTMW